VFDEDSFSPVAKIKGDKQYSILSDYLGTPTHVFDFEGDVIWETRLDSYGKMQLEKGKMGSCPFRFQGQYEDYETGLYYNRFRYYSPEEGGYISQDPIGLDGGSAFYAYVHDTNLWLDVFGLSSCKPTKFHKRTVGEVAKLRKAFDKSGGAREKFLKKLGNDPKSISRYGQKAVNQMKQGKVPDNMVVHHKKPLFRGGTNKHSNLDLIDKKHHSTNNKDLHWYPEGENPYGLN
jgi:RHS repeat-associated protein